jgi:hypothetical protein
LLRVYVNINTFRVSTSENIHSRNQTIARVRAHMPGISRREELGLQLALVAEGVRPAWLVYSKTYTRAEVEARIVELRPKLRPNLELHCSPDLHVAGEDMGFLVSRRRLRVPRVVTHKWIGDKLGLPCAKRDPWGPANRRAYAVVGIKGRGDKLAIVPARGPGAAGGWEVRAEASANGGAARRGVGQPLIITTFWCRHASDAQAWCDALAARSRGGFTERWLEVRDLELFYFVLAHAVGAGVGPA